MIMKYSNSIREKCPNTDQKNSEYGYCSRSSHVNQFVCIITVFFLKNVKIVKLGIEICDKLGFKKIEICSLFYA